MTRVRFAPSPTGPLHIGGVRTALFNYLFAKKNNGTMILRIEDTDQNRYVEGAEEYIMDSLNWCGIKIDEGIREGGDFGPYRQSERKDIYGKYAKLLLDSGWAYMAIDTPEELNKLRLEAEQNKDLFVYNFESRKHLKNSLTMSNDEVQKMLSDNIPYVLRFKMPENRMLKLNDIIRGEVKFNTSELDDKVLMKTDGLPTYHLANIVDDHLMEITHVIRGEEWLPSLPLHFLLYEAFGWKAPEFAHLPLILKPTGKGKLSKRDGDKMGFPVFPTEWKIGEEVYRGYREDGYFPEALVNMLALLGWNPGTEQEIFSMEQLISEFSLDRVGKSGSRFDPEKTKWFNHQYLVEKSGEEIADLFVPVLEEKGIKSEKETVIRICDMLKERVNFVPELWGESYFFFAPPTEFDEKFMKKHVKEDTAELMESLIEKLMDIDEFTAVNTESVVKLWLESSQIGFGKVMSPFRLALVGAGKGPHVFDIIEIIGKDDTLARLRTFVARLHNL
ncbi:MAG: glutamate--tRNA ligase [Bacteroidales bacterium]|nr:glutamate--tRNA ligase [Bacteroidales bacterium]